MAVLREMIQPGRGGGREPGLEVVEEDSDDEQPQKKRRRTDTRKKAAPVIEESDDDSDLEITDGDSNRSVRFEDEVTDKNAGHSNRVEGLEQESDDELAAEKVEVLARACVGVEPYLRQRIDRMGKGSSGIYNDADRIVILGQIIQAG
ncbi:MAG: hypothetical protein Q9218_006241 [Villophora microphyllina]